MVHNRLFFIIFFLCTCYAYGQNVLSDSLAKQYDYSAVIKVDSSQDKDVLYLKALCWLDVMREQYGLHEVKNYHLDKRDFVAFPFSFIANNGLETINFYFVLQIKDGRYKYAFSNVNIAVCQLCSHKLAPDVQAEIERGFTSFINSLNIALLNPGEDDSW